MYEVSCMNLDVSHTMVLLMFAVTEIDRILAHCQTFEFYSEHECMYILVSFLCITENWYIQVAAVGLTAH